MFTPNVRVYPQNKTFQETTLYLAEFAPVNPEKLTNEKHRTRAWPHSDRVGQRKQNAFAPVKRGVDVGEIVSFDWSHRGTNCSQEVEKWYSEIFFFDPADPLKARKLSPEQGDHQQVGHLTQLQGGFLKMSYFGLKHGHLSAFLGQKT